MFAGVTVVRALITVHGSLSSDADEFWVQMIQYLLRTVGPRDDPARERRRLTMSKSFGSVRHCSHMIIVPEKD